MKVDIGGFKIFRIEDYSNTMHLTMLLSAVIRYLRDYNPNSISVAPNIPNSER